MNIIILKQALFDTRRVLNERFEKKKFIKFLLMSFICKAINKNTPIKQKKNKNNNLYVYYNHYEIWKAKKQNYVCAHHCHSKMCWEEKKKEIASHISRQSVTRESNSQSGRTFFAAQVQKPLPATNAQSCSQIFQTDVCLCALQFNYSKPKAENKNLRKTNQNKSITLQINKATFLARI